MRKILFTLFCLPAFCGWSVPAGAQQVDTTMWTTNGAVHAIVRSGNTIYLGGRFNYVGPVTGNGALLNATDGRLNGTPPLHVAGVIHAAISDGKGGWFIGGEFNSVRGVARRRLAHILPDGRLDNAWNPTMGETSTVRALALAGNTLYIGGRFMEVNGQFRSCLAALDATTGRLTNWDPGAGNAVNAIVVSGNVVYVGGGFNTIRGQNRNRLAAVDATTGEVLDWNPRIYLYPLEQVFAIAVAGNIVYIGGSFNQVGSAFRRKLAAIDATTGEVTLWNPAPYGDVYTLAASGSVVYAGGSFDFIGGQPRRGLAALDAATGRATTWNPQLHPASSGVASLVLAENKVYVGGWFERVGDQPRNNLAAIDATTGQATAWDPRPGGGVNALAVANNTVFAGGGFSSIGGQVRKSLAALDAATGRATAWNPGADWNLRADNVVFALAATEGVVYAGGRFSSAGGQPRRNLAAFEAATGRATAWNPGANRPVLALAASGDRVYAGGEFDTISGQHRDHIAAVSRSTGRPSAWNPGMNGAVHALALSGNVLYAGGGFSSVGGQVRPNLAALDVTTGGATAWNPSPDSAVLALSVTGNGVYAGGHFSSVGGQPRSRLAAIDAATGQPTPWNPEVSTEGALNLRSYVAALSSVGNTMYVGGSFVSVSGQSRSSLAAFDLAEGRITAWNPNAAHFVFALSAHSNVVYAGGELMLVGGRRTSGFVAIGQQARPLNYITGNVYQETEGNCTRSAGEKGMGNVVIVARPGNYFASTDALGNYTLAVEAGTYTVSQVIAADKAGLIAQVCPAEKAPHQVSFPGLNQTVTGINFANRVERRPHLAVTVSSSRRRRCFTATTTIGYCNSGTAGASNVKVYLRLPEHVVPVRANVAYTRDHDGNLVFAIGDLAPDRCGSIQLVDSVVCNNPSIRGLTQCTKAWITPANARTPDPQWDRSDITLKAACQNNGRVRMGIYNTGEGNMADSSAFRIYLDAQLAFSRLYKLNRGDSLILQVPANGRTIRLEADQRPGHPVRTQSSITLEACGTNAEGKVSLGYVAQLPCDDPEPEVAEECLPIIDSFDPNDKAVSPRGVTDRHYTPTRSRLDYLVRFQNTGTDVAYTVVVVDTLSEHLDIGTLQVGAVSHPYRVAVSGKGRPVLTFTFNNINLPDSTADEPRSHGYIQFSVKPKENLPVKTRIENYADIFFDYNEPIRTNTTFNTMYDLPPVPAGAVKLDQSVVCVATNTTVAAGADRTLCEQDTVRLGAAPPAWGSGRWERITGTAAVGEPENPASPVSGLAYGENVFQWSVPANTCGTDSLKARITITRLRKPATPVITPAGADSLECSPATGGYQWYFEGNPVPLQSRRIKAAGAGNYAVRVTDGAGCPSDLSAAFAWLPTGVEPAFAALVRIYPNPTPGRFAVAFPAGLGQRVRISVYDALGREIAVREVPGGTAGEQVAGFDVQAGKRGMYLVKLQTAKGVIVRKVFKQ